MEIYVIINMLMTYTLPRKDGYPLVRFHSQLGELIDDFRHNQEVHVELMALQGCTPEDRESLEIVYQPFSERLRESVRKRGETHESDVNILTTKGEYSFDSRQVRIFAGHNLAWDGDESGYVDMRRLNNVLLHETGHFVDDVVNGNKNRHISERAAIKVGVFGLELAKAALGLGKGRFIEELHPFYLGMPLEAVAMVAGSATIGSLVAVAGSGLVDYTYSKSPRERFANDFQKKHESFWITDGNAPIFNVAEAVTKYAFSMD